MIDGGEHGPAESFRFGPAPRDEPLTYPGAIPAFSFLFTGDAIEAIEDGDGGGDRLDRLLAGRHAAPMGRRHAVLAYGSNRSPAQLRSKFAGASVNPTFPVIRSRVHGLSAVFAAYLSSYGSVPATLTPDRGAVTETSVTYLDDDQLALVDATEPLQERPVIDGDRHRLELVGGGTVARFVCYRSERSLLTIDGRAVRLAEVGSSGSALVARSQAQVHEALGGVDFDFDFDLGPDLGDPMGVPGGPGATGAVAAAVRSDPGTRARVNERLAQLVRRPAGPLGARPAVPFGLDASSLPILGRS